MRVLLTRLIVCVVACVGVTTVASAQDALMKGRKLRGAAMLRTRAVLGHAIAFSTWRSLAREQGLDDHTVVQLMSTLVDDATAR